MFSSLVQRFGGFLRIGFLSVLSLLLLIPVSMVRSMISERDQRAKSVVSEISSKWGREQTLGAIRLDIPCTTLSTDTAGKTHEQTTWIHAWPETLAVNGNLETELRKRGIYSVPLFVAGLDLSGRFRLPDPAALGLAGAVPRWEDARIVLDAGDIQSISRPPSFELGGKPVELAPTGATRTRVQRVVRDGGDLEPVPQDAALESEPSLRLGGAAHLGGALAGQSIPFRFQVSLRGQGMLAIHPLAHSTSVRLTSDWASPSFDGRFLPTTHNVRPTGFDASWSVSSLNLDVPMQWTGDQAIGTVPMLGVRMVEPVDGYASSDRSLKYAYLFLTLTFLAFFLFEAFLDTQMHPLQYTLIGLANCLFYLLTLAISEHLGFDAAYWIAAVATTLLISGYAASALSGWSRAAILGTGTLGLYGFLFTLLKAEDWSLLMGTCGLFAILAFVMWLTRKRLLGTMWAGKLSEALPAGDSRDEQF